MTLTNKPVPRSDPSKLRSLGGFVLSLQGLGQRKPTPETDGFRCQFFGGGDSYEKRIRLKTFGNDVFYTNYLIVLVKNMLCS